MLKVRAGKLRQSESGSGRVPGAPHSTRTHNGWGIWDCAKLARVLQRRKAKSDRISTHRRKRPRFAAGRALLPFATRLADSDLSTPSDTPTHTHTHISQDAVVCEDRRLAGPTRCVFCVCPVLLSDGDINHPSSSSELNPLTANSSPQRVQQLPSPPSAPPPPSPPPPATMPAPPSSRTPATAWPSPSARRSCCPARRAPRAWCNTLCTSPSPPERE